MMMTLLKKKKKNEDERDELKYNWDDHHLNRSLKVSIVEVRHHHQSLLFLLWCGWKDDLKRHLFEWWFFQGKEAFRRGLW